MEQNLKQHTLTYESGITSVPSDVTSPDSALASADGIVYLDGEYKALQNLTAAIIPDKGYKLAFVHELNNGTTKNKLYLNGTTLVFGNSTLATRVSDVKSIGNTLIVNTSSGIYYLLWNGSSYTPLGNHIPEPKVELSLEISSKTYSANASINGIALADMTSYGHYGRLLVDSDNLSSFENACVGIYAEVKNKVADDNLFLNPFFIRYAVELYDGSYTMISNPILMHTFFGKNLIYAVSGYDSDANPKILSAQLNALTLKVSQNTDYSDYSDIVKGITLFVSSPVDRYITNQDDVAYEDVLKGNKAWKSFEILESTPITSVTIYTAGSWSTVKNIDTENTHFYYWLLSRKDDDDIVKELKNSSVFYKLCDIGRKIIDNVDASSFIEGKVVKNITTQQQLQYDDYYGYTKLTATGLYTFNRRLNLTGVTRSFFGGFTTFSNLIMGSESRSRIIYVRIKTSSGNRVVSAYSGTFSYDPLECGTWFFYPDPRADHVWVFNYSSGSCIFSEDLTEHPFLNGAYYFSSIPNDSKSLPSAKSYSGSVTVNTAVETLPNYLLQSEVDNPFTFFASGYVRVGQGTIIGMAGLTTALSQDAYKISTTLVFTTQGIWALRINDEGQYTSVAPPFSREVCSYADTITMTDNAVFFVSKKGLMCVTGESESSVVCVSKNLKDSDFVTFCNNSNCRIAYDYKEQLLYVVQIGGSNAYVYSISTGTWTTDSNVFNSGNELLAVVTDYPDTYLQEDYNPPTVYSFLNRNNRDKDSSFYNFSFTTRPLKLSGSLIPESIRRVKQLLHPDIKVFTDTTEYNASTAPSMLMTIKGSNDLSSWYDVPSVGGKPFRFFQLTYQFKYLSATHTFSATVLLTQQRHTNRFV